MALPRLDVLVDDINGLETISDSTLVNIVTAAIIQTLQGAPLNPDLPRQALITASNPLQCLDPQAQLALLVRKFLELLLSLGGVTSSGVQEFETVEEMVADGSAAWGMAVTSNYLLGDSWMTYWVRLRGSDLIANGDDLAAAFDGSILWRVAVREHTGPQVILPPAPALPYEVSPGKIFPALSDIINSQLDLLSFWVLDGDSNLTGWVRDPFATQLGVQNVDWIVNAVGIYYKKVAVPIIKGAGSPEGVQAATPNQLYQDTDNDQIYLKKTGSGNTGWKLYV
jgi:hypothetical protein